MAQRFGGKYSPDAPEHGPDTPSEFRGKTRTRVGGRANVLFFVPLPLAIRAFTGDASQLALNLIAFGTLILAAIVDAMTPLLQRVATRLWQDIDYLLARKPSGGTLSWVPSVGDTVRFLDQPWTVEAIEILLDDGSYYLCKIANEQHSRWVSQEQLQLVASA